MTFKEHKPNVWQYENVGDAVEGKVVSIEDNKSFKGKKVYTLETEKGTLIVFGTTILDSKMIGVKQGQVIRIVYEGTKEGKNSSQNPTKLFKVLIDDGK